MILNAKYKRKEIRIRLHYRNPEGGIINKYSIQGRFQ